VQRALGVVAEPLLLERGPDQLATAAAEAAIAVIGLSDRWRSEGLGSVRASLARAGGRRSSCAAVFALAVWRRRLR
jgi:hypothetical protein